MKRLLYLCILPLLSGALWCQVTQTATGPELGLSVGQRGGDSSVSIDLTSPYLKLLDGYVALRAAGDGYITGGQLASSSTASYDSYFSTRLGIVAKKAISDNIDIFSEIGALLLFPNRKISTSTDSRWGFYGDVGLDFYTDASKKLSWFIDAGYQLTIDPLLADKYTGAQLLGSGATVSAGCKFHL
jgi:hypothetical protein